MYFPPLLQSKVSEKYHCGYQYFLNIVVLNIFKWYQAPYFTKSSWLFSTSEEKGNRHICCSYCSPSWSCDPGGDVIAASIQQPLTAGFVLQLPACSFLQHSITFTKTKQCLTTDNKSRELMLHQLLSLLFSLFCTTNRSHQHSGASTLSPCRSLDSQTVEKGFNRIWTKPTLFLCLDLSVGFSAHWITSSLHSEAVRKENWHLQSFNCCVPNPWVGTPH